MNWVAYIRLLIVHSHFVASPVCHNVPMNVTIAPRTGLTLKNPVMTASGTFGYGTEFASREDVSGLGAIVCKGTTREPRSGHAPIRMTETAAGMLNAIGLQNIGIEAVIREHAPRWATLDVPFLVNVSGTSIEDYTHIVSRLNHVPGVGGVELNISCPNVREGGVMFGSRPSTAAAVTDAVRSVTDLPLLVKLTPNVADIRSIAAAVESAGADAVCVANTVYGLAIDIQRREPTLANVTGGLSGPAIKPYALYLVYQVAQEVSIPVIGVGGIMTATDVLEFLMAGATAVELGTALLLDPTCWRRIIRDLETWRDGEGVDDWRHIIGTANTGFKGKAGGKLSRRPNWWRWGRIERPVQKAGHKHVYKRSRYFNLTGGASTDKVSAGQLISLSGSYERSDLPHGRLYGAVTNPSAMGRLGVATD